MDDLITNHRISSYECGADLLLKPSAFLHFCQEVAEQHADHHGLGYDWGMSQGMIWVEVQADFELLRRPRWKEPVQLRTNTGKATPLQARRFVEMTSAATGELLARADLMWVLIDLHTRRPIPLRKAQLDLHNDCPPTCSDPDFKSRHTALDSPDTITAESSLVAPRRDVDFNGHINNAAYLIWALDSLPETMLPGAEPQRLRLCFRHETHAGTPLSIRHSILGSHSHHVICDANGETKAEIDILWQEMPAPPQHTNTSQNN